MIEVNIGYAYKVEDLVDLADRELLVLCYLWHTEDGQGPGLISSIPVIYFVSSWLKF